MQDLLKTVTTCLEDMDKETRVEFFEELLKKFHHVWQEIEHRELVNQMELQNERIN